MYVIATDTFNPSPDANAMEAEVVVGCQDATNSVKYAACVVPMEV